MARAAREAPTWRHWPSRALWAAGLTSAFIALAAGVLADAGLNALRAVKENEPFDFGSAVFKVLHPASVVDAVDLIGAVLFGLLSGLAVAAYRAARGQPTAIT